MIEDIVKVYEQTHSIKATADENKCSWNRVTKILSSQGVVINDTHALILKLKDEGMNVEQISEQIGINKKTVQSYLPGVRPAYKENISENAKRIKRCRDRNKGK